LKRIVVVLGWAMPLFAQYAGPAILSRGDAPSGMSGPQINFRPFVEVSGVYETGLTGVSLNAQGQLANTAAEGVELGFGVSGSHSWRHTTIGLSYRGNIRHYDKATYYDGTDQSLLLSLRHQFTRHIALNLRESAGLFSENLGTPGLAQTVAYDPSQSYIPTTDFFDNRTIYASTQADIVIQKSSRLSFDIGGTGFLNRRRSTALYGVTGGTAMADVQYRISRRTTIGANYNYNHYSFTGIFSSTDINGANGTYAIQLTRRLEFSAYGGFSRVETKFVQNVPVDPAITAIIGITEGTSVIYSVRYIPNVSARLSQTIPRGVLYISGGHTVTPGNGLFLTSTMTNITAGYSYTGLRRWSFNLGAMYDDNNSIGNVTGRYRDVNGTLSASRQVARSIHAILSLSARKYESNAFTLYNRVFYTARLGIGFTPGDVPLRIW